MPGGLHRHCCCEPGPGPCGACPQVGESITAVVSGIEICGCMVVPGLWPMPPLYVKAQLLSGSINGVHTLEWWPYGIDTCSWRSGPIARIRTIRWFPPCSGPCDCSPVYDIDRDVYIDLHIRPDPPATRLRMFGGIFDYSASEIRCEGEYQNQNLICGGGEVYGLPLFVGGTITLSR